MRKGVFQGCFPTQMVLSECLCQAKSHGFSGIELCVDAARDTPLDLVKRGDDILGIAKSVGADTLNPGSLRLDSSDDEIRAIGKKAEELGIQVHSVLSLLLFLFPITSPNKRVRDVGIEVAERLIHIARTIGADTVLFIPGMVTSDTPYDEAYARARDVMKMLIKRAEDAQVCLAVENVWNRFLLSPLEMRDFIDSFRSDAVSCYFDVGNTLNYGYPEQWIRILGKRIRRVHMKDFSLSIGNILGFVHLFRGDVDWTAVMAALRDVGYDGYLTIEVPPYKTYPLETLRHSSEALDLLLNRTG